MLRVHRERLPASSSAERAALALADRPGLVWLDGDETHPDGAWSFVASDPVDVHVADDLTLPQLHAGSAAGDVRVPEWIGYVAYEPAVWLARYDAVLGFDERRGEAWIFGDDAAACARLAERSARAPQTVEGRVIGEVIASPADAHGRAIERALEHIARGDIYQVNLARRWSARWEGDPLALFLAMRRASAVPLGAFIDAGDHAVLARTMETFLDWSGPGGRLVTRPIKGTIPRERGDVTNAARALRADPKEQAEHSMIVDLMRNDLGRVAITGSVRVERVMDVEPFAGLSHLVSTVACETRADATIEDVLRATFPPGSVTGAPKVRAVEIIEALEPHPRGVYCGAIGMIDRAGGAKLAVAIRTAQIDEGEVRYHAGGGIVEASDVEREIAETELKARAFLDAIAALDRRSQDERLGATAR